MVVLITLAWNKAKSGDYGTFLPKGYVKPILFGKGPSLRRQSNWTNCIFGCTNQIGQTDAELFAFDVDVAVGIVAVARLVQLDACAWFAGWLYPSDGHELE